MRTIYTIILVTAVAVVMWSGVAVAEENGWAGSRHGRGRGPRMMTEERTERVLSQIEQTDPEEAEELKCLRQEDPNKFRERLGEHFRRGFGEKRKQHMGEEWGKRPREGRRKMMQRGGEGRMRERMWKEHAEFMSWLAENYSEKAEKLNKLQQEDPGEYFMELRSVMKTYKPIMEASKKNPALADVLKEDLRLKEERGGLLAEIKSATDKGEKEQLTNQLGRVVAERFELIIKRKQIRYEELLQKLERLKEQVERRKNEVDSLKSRKADKVKERLEELLSNAEKVNWD